MFKQVMVSLAIASSIFVAQHVPEKSTNQVHVASEKIVKVSYSEIENVFYAYTEKDRNGGAWVFAEDDVSQTLDEFRQKVVGHKVDIYYIGDNQNDTEIEIIKTVIH